MKDFLKRLLLWGVRKAAYLVVAAGVLFVSNYLGAHEQNMMGMRLDAVLAGLSTVVASELRRKFAPEFLSALMTGEVPNE